MFFSSSSGIMEGLSTSVADFFSSPVALAIYTVIVLIIWHAIVKIIEKLRKGQGKKEARARKRLRLRMRKNLAAQASRAQTGDESDSQADSTVFSDHDATVSESFAFLHSVDGDHDDGQEKSLLVKERSDAAAELGDVINNGTLRQVEIVPACHIRIIGTADGNQGKRVWFSIAHLPENSIDTRLTSAKEYKEFVFCVKKINYSVFIPYFVLFHLERVVRNETLHGAVRLIMLWTFGKDAMVERRLGIDSEKQSTAVQFTHSPLTVIERHFILAITRDLDLKSRINHTGDWDAKLKKAIETVLLRFQHDRDEYKEYRGNVIYGKLY